MVEARSYFQTLTLSPSQVRPKLLVEAVSRHTSMPLTTESSPRVVGSWDRLNCLQGPPHHCRQQHLQGERGQGVFSDPEPARGLCRVEPPTRSRQVAVAEQDKLATSFVQHEPAQQRPPEQQHAIANLHTKENTHTHTHTRRELEDTVRGVKNTWLRLWDKTSGWT